MRKRERQRLYIKSMQPLKLKCDLFYSAFDKCLYGYCVCVCAHACVCVCMC